MLFEDLSDEEEKAPPIDLLRIEPPTFQPSDHLEDGIEDDDYEIWTLRLPVSVNIKAMDGIELQVPDESTHHQNLGKFVDNSKGQEYGITVANETENESFRLLVDDEDEADRGLVPRMAPFARHINVISVNALEEVPDIELAPRLEAAKEPACPIRRAYTPVPQVASLKRRWVPPGVSTDVLVVPNTTKTEKRKRKTSKTKTKEKAPEKSNGSRIAMNEPESNGDETPVGPQTKRARTMGENRAKESTEVKKSSVVRKQKPVKAKLEREEDSASASKNANVASSRDNTKPTGREKASADAEQSSLKLSKSAPKEKENGDNSSKPKPPAPTKQGKDNSASRGKRKNKTTKPGKSTKEPLKAKLKVEETVVSAPSSVPGSLKKEIVPPPTSKAPAAATPASNTTPQEQENGNNAPKLAKQEAPARTTQESGSQTPGTKSKTRKRGKSTGKTSKPKTSRESKKRTRAK